MRSNTSSAQIAKALTEYHLVYRNFFKGIIKSSTMPLTQYHILTVLSDRSNMRMGEISQIMAISRPNLTPLIDKLVLTGYVERVSDSNDRRVTYINITSIGKKALQTERNAIGKSVEELTSKMTEDESIQFNEAIQTLSVLSKKMLIASN